MDEKATIDELKRKVKDFCEARDWDQFHNIKELSIGLSTESSELLQHFRFKSESESDDFFKKNREAVGDEIADVTFFLLRLTQKYDIDISEELRKKLEKNEKRYSVEKFKGSNKRHNE